MSFQGNENLRGSALKFEYTSEQRNEIAKCMLSHEYFFENYVRILSLDSESLILFDPRKYQVEFAQMILDNRRTIAKWARQSGKSTIVSAILLYLILFNANFRILIVANKAEKAQEILEVVQSMYENLPPFMQQGVLGWGKKSIKLANGSLIKTAGTSGSSGRGGTYNMIYLDEFAHVPTHVAEDFFRSVLPVISSGKATKVVITSTPKGLNKFYSIWKDSLEGKNEFLRSEIRWFDVPGRDDEWKRKEVAANGEEYFRQEFNSEFIGSSDTLISGSKLTQLRWAVPLVHTDNVDVYAHPEENHKYVITVDISEGIGRDSSVVMCFDITALPYQVVCVYRTNTTTSLQMPGIIYNMGKTFNEAMIMIENASEGAQVANMLHYDMEYPSVMTTTSTTKNGQVLSSGFAGGTQRMGVKMSQQVKAIGCSNLKTLIENDRLIINDHTLLQELYRFVKSKKSFEADEGHDDHVMCCVLLGWLADQGYIREVSGVDIRKDVSEAYRSLLEDRAAPIIARDTGREVDMEAEARDLLIASRREKQPRPQKDPAPDPHIQDIIDRAYPNGKDYFTF